MIASPQLEYGPQRPCALASSTTCATACDIFYKLFSAVVSTTKKVNVDNDFVTALEGIGVEYEVG